MTLTSNLGTTMGVMNAATITYSYSGTGSVNLYDGSAVVAGSATDAATTSISGTYTFRPSETGTKTFTIREGTTVKETLTITVASTAPYQYVNYYVTTIKHKLTATISNQDSQKWQESTDGTTWTDITGETGTTLIHHTFTGAEATSQANAESNALAATSSYDKYYRCVATNATGDTNSNVLHVVYTAGQAQPTVTNVTA